MLENVTFPMLPELTKIDFSHPSEVLNLIRKRCLHQFGNHDVGYIDEYIQTTENLFAGRHSEYQPMDTAYHDINHTLQATLCLVELLHNRSFTDATPRIGAEDFKRALIAILFHDIGYLKLIGDNEGSGAKYTHIHEKRSSKIARTFLKQRNWSTDNIVFVENLISATGPNADLTKIDFRSDIERLLGQAVCTADYIGQMSDPHYPDKLEVLFSEFKESYQYQKIPEKKWLFANYGELLTSTPGFWDKFVQDKLLVQCEGQSKYLKHTVTGRNPYLESIELNLALIKQKIAIFADQEP